MPVLLSDLTTLGLGGPAARWVEATTEEQLVETVRDLDAAGEPVLVVGGGSNLVVSDAGFPGTVVLVANRDVSVVGDRVEVAAGVDWDDLVRTTVEQGLAGMECLSGIPGRVGATPVQNVGAYGQEVAQTVTSVRAYDRVADEVVTLTPEECRFSYRMSRFKAEAGRWVVLSVAFQLAPGPLSTPVRYAELADALSIAVGESAPLAEARQAVLTLRRAKGMVLDPSDPDSRSAGSFFTNPVLSAEQLAALIDRLPIGVSVPSYQENGGAAKVSAAWLIEQAGFCKGDLPGPVGISSKHVLALVNRGGGSTADLIRAARLIRDAVHERFGIALVPEPVLVGVSL